MFDHDVVGHSRDPLRFGLWQWMIATAYFRDSGDIMRGTFKTTTRQMAEISKLHRSSVVRFVAELVESGMVEVVKKGGPKKPSIYRVVNYDRYQPGANHKANRNTDHSVNHKRTAANSDTAGVPGGPETINEPFPEPLAEPLGESLQKERSSEQNSKNKTLARARVVSDETGTEWPEPSAGFEYPPPFKAIWSDWKAAEKTCKVTANGKLAAYKQIRRHIKAKTLTLAQIQRATTGFLGKYRAQPELYGAPQPPRFYGKQGDIFDYLTTLEATGPAPMRERWHNPRDAWRECASLANHLGVEIPEVPKRAYGAEWEDVEAFHPLVIQYATDRAGFKTMPDDLAQQVRGGK